MKRLQSPQQTKHRLREPITKDGKDLQGFTKNLIALRKQHDALCADRFLHGQKPAGTDADVSWRRKDGQTMHGDDWKNQNADTFGMMLNEDVIDTPGKPDTGKRLMTVFNRSAAPQEFTLPVCEAPQGTWQRKLDTDSTSGIPTDTTRKKDGEKIIIAPHSVAVFTRRP